MSGTGYRWSLRHDPEKNALRLVAEDRFDGLHERLEWAIVNSEGGPVRNRADLDLVQAYMEVGYGAYFLDQWGARVRVSIREPAETVTRAPCRSATNSRLKCPLCKTAEAEREVMRSYA